MNAELSLHFSNLHFSSSIIVPCSGDIFVGSSAAGIFAEVRVKISPVEGNNKLSMVQHRRHKLLLY